MAIVGEAEVILTLDKEAFKAELADTAADTDTSALGEAAGADMGAGMAAGAKDATSDLKDIGEDGALALGAGAGDVAEDATKPLEDAVEDSKGRIAKTFDSMGEKAQSTLEGLGVPSTLLSGYAAAALGIGAVAGVSLDLAHHMQEADVAIANSAGTSVQAATNIGNAMLATAGSTKFSGEQQAEAFAGVAGQLKAVEGHALTTSQAMQVSSAAMDLATAKGVDLNTSMSTIASTLQAFQMSTSQSGEAADVLFNASNATGQGIDTLGAALDKVRAKLGATAPPLGQMAGLLLDMTNHGETGRVAMTALNSVFTTLQKPLTALTSAQAQLKTAQDALPPSLQKLAQGYMDGSISGDELYKKTENLSGAQSMLWSEFTSAETAVQKATMTQKEFGITLTNSKGQMLPFSQIIAELGDKVKGMTKEQALAELGTLGFTSSAAQLLPVIEAGASGFDDATASVTKLNSAHDAAVNQSQTLADEFETVKSAAEDYGTELGQDLMPILQELMQLVEVLVPIIGDALKVAFMVLKPVITVVVDALKLVIGTLTDLADFVVSIFEGRWETAWHDVEHAFVDVWDAVDDFVKGIPSRIFGWLVDAIKFEFVTLPEDMLKIGEDVVKGLVKGIEDGIGLVKKAAEDISHHVIDAVKDVFSILSPSAVMHDVGTNVVQGLANGIRDRSSVAEAEARNMALRVRDAATPGRLNAARFGSDGGVVLEVNIAQGAVVIHPAPGNDEALMHHMEDAIEAAFRDLGNELRGGISQLTRASA